MDDNRLRELLDDMSLEEKIGQLVLIPGSYFEKDFVITGPANYLSYTEREVALAGSVLTVIGAGKLKEIQKEYMKKHPHHIPLLFMADIINGYRTIFPIPLGQGASFDPALSKEAAGIAARESAYAGLHLVYSPMVDLVRDARWGRVMESTGEDPFLNSVFARAIVEGYQGEQESDGHPDLTKEGKVSACVKHFAAYGGAQSGRDYNTVELSERTLREDYLPAYKAAVDSGCETLMSSFNVLNRIPASANTHLMREILREEWGFDGVVISDWAAIGELITHGIAENEKEAAFLAIKAGVDMDMCTRCYSSNLEALVKEGRVEERLVDEAVMRVLRLKNRLGLFENPFKDADEDKEKSYILCDLSRKAAEKAARDSFVLLKNEGLLPIRDMNDTAFIGPFTDSGLLYGAWSIFAAEEDTVSIKDALKNAGFSSPVAKGCVLCADHELKGMHGAAIAAIKDEERDERLIKEAVLLAKASGTVVLTLGEPNAMSGEAASRGMLDIPRIQQRLLREVAAVNKNIVVVLFTGRPLDLREISSLARSVLVVWQPGSEGGNAIVDVLSGRTSPSGKLSMSFPYSVGQVPVHYNELSTGRPYTPGDDNKFLSKYIDIPNAPLYPFGFGLTYSEFEISEIKLDRDVMRMGASDRITAGVTLRNRGSVEASEVVQLYIRDEYASAARPVRLLKGFKKVALKPAEETEVVFEISEDMLAFWKSDDTFGAERGYFCVYIGNSSTTENKARFRLE